MPVRRHAALRLGLALALALAAAPGAADWLVLRDGSRLEIDGAWRQRGELAVFKLRNGSLSSVRLAEVDEPASREATAAAATKLEKGRAPQPPRRRPVRVLTDADFKRAESPPAVQEPAAAAPEAAAPAAVPESEVRVTSWDQTTTPGVGLAVSGTLSNGDVRPATDLALEVVVFDVTGLRRGAAPATLERTILPPGGTTRFDAVFPGVFGVVAAKFNVTHRAFEPRAEPAAAEPPSE